MDILKANIENLTGLWKTVGRKTNSFHSEKNISYCKVEYSEWPNRLWFKENINDSELEIAKKIISNSPVNLKITVWNLHEKTTDNLLEKHGFSETSQLMGMSGTIPEKIKLNHTVQLQKVNNEDEAGLWSVLFKKAFDYKISSPLILQSCEDIHYYIAWHQNQAIGTCIIYNQNDEVIGFHALGIIPEMRRKGYAEEIFKILLAKSRETGFKYAILQASDSGKNLYLKYGFKENFLLKNYILMP